MWPYNHLQTLMLHIGRLALFCVKISLGVSQTLKFTSAPFRILEKKCNFQLTFCVSVEDSYTLAAQVTPAGRSQHALHFPEDELMCFVQILMHL